ncbi:MAG TPA: glycosyltransferase family 87 protein [Stellaceae bacterium]
MKMINVGSSAAGPAANAPRSPLRVAVLLCSLCSLYGWLTTASEFAADPFQDWAVFHAAATGYFRFGDWSAIFANWSLPDHPWLYPPSFLLLLLPFGTIGFGAGCSIFLVLTFLCMIAVIWRFAGERRWLCTLALILSPATMVNVYLGQNAFLSGALFFGGALALRTRPVLAGMLFGLLAYKPQIALLVPVALIAARQWKALGAATVTALLVAILSALVFGASAWQSWLGMVTGTEASSLAIGRLHGGSVFTCAILFGAAPSLANALQLAATLLAAACVYASYRRPMPEFMRVATLAAATILGAPHVTGYDAILTAFAAALLFAEGMKRGFRPGELPIAWIVWASPLFGLPMSHPVARLMPLLVALFIAAIFARSRAYGDAGSHEVSRGDPAFGDRLSARPASTSVASPE